MFKLIQNPFPLIFILLLVTLLSLWYYPSVAPVLGIATLLFGLALGIHDIFEKHQTSGSLRLKIAKDILILVITLLLTIFLGGLAGMYANSYASPRFGALAGFVFAITASFVVGYLVNKGVGKIFR